MDIQRLRNLTTGRLHTDISDVYQDLGYIIGDHGIMTHMLPRLLDAVEPWLRQQITNARFWDGTHDPTHVGDFPLRSMTREESAAAAVRYGAMANPLRKA
jgi:hypothetical protein